MTPNTPPAAGQRQPIFDMSRLSLGSDIAAKDYQVTYVVDRLVPEGSITLLYSKGGSGKSTLATQMGGAVSSGTTFMGLGTSQRPVVIIDYENPNAVLKKRIKAVAGAENVYFWTGSNTPPQINQKEWVGLKDLVLELENPLIFIDTLSSSTSGLDILSNGDYSKVMARIIELRNLGATIVLLHHTPKGDATQYIGASAIYNQCDHILAMYPVRKPGAEAEAIDEDEAKVYRLGTKDKTRFEPFRLFIEFDEESAVFKEAQDPDRDTLEKIKAIIEGLAPNATQTAVVLEARERGLPEKKTRRLLHAYEGRLWNITAGPKNAKIYQPTSVWQFGNPIYSCQTAKQENGQMPCVAKQGKTEVARGPETRTAVESGSLASIVSPDCQTCQTGDRVEVVI